MLTTAPTTALSSASQAPSGAGLPVIALPQCRKQALPTHQTGILTVGTGTVPDPPWFVTAGPADGRGLDAAVIAAVGATLGLRPGDVRWRTGLGIAALADPTVDVYLDHLTIPDSPGSTVEYSTGYYDQHTAILVPAAAGAGLTLAGLRTIRVGALSGTFAADALRTNGVPDGSVTAEASVDQGVPALRTGAIDALALPAWQAVSVAASKGSGATVAGLLPAGDEQPPQWGIALAANSALTPCISAAVDALRAEGELETLADRWIGNVTTLR